VNRAAVNLRTAMPRLAAIAARITLSDGLSATGTKVRIPGGAARR
jgi:hypothetical protein